MILKNWRALSFALTTSLTLTAGLSVAAQDDANRPVTDKWAVVVGISKFADSKLDLRYPAKDAQDFYNYLITKGNFAKDHVKLLLDEKATRDRIRDVLGDSWLPHAALPQDLVVIFISSHGSSSELDLGGVNYIVAHDTNPNKLFTTGIPMSQLASIIKDRVHSDRVLVVLDTCHAGGARSESKGIVRQGNADAQALAQGTGQLVICSSDTNQVSWEGKNFQNSVFTKTLIDSLEKQNNGPVTKVFEQVKEKVVEQVVQERGVMQTPVLEASKWSGNDLVLSCVPSQPRKARPEIVEEDYSPQETIADAVSNKPSVIASARTSQSAPVSQKMTQVQRPLFVPAATGVVSASGAPKTSFIDLRTNADEQKTNSGTIDKARLVRESSPMDFLRYHLGVLADKRFKYAWDDLGPNYRSKFKNDFIAYVKSVSRHRILSTAVPDSDIKVLPKKGLTQRVRVRMTKVTGVNSVWVYDLSLKDGIYYIDDVALSSLPLEAE